MIKEQGHQVWFRHRMIEGKTLLNHTRFLGYTKGPDGVLKIVPEEAEVVRKIFDLYVQGSGVRKIKKYLEFHGIKTVTGKSEWSTSTIDRMLSNEKYAGDVLMQKTHTPDFLTGKKEKNQGQVEKYLAEAQRISLNSFVEQALAKSVAGQRL